MRFQLHSARVPTAAAAIGIAMLSAAPLRAQFSPGPLSSSHAAIDRVNACLECHEPKRATTPARCLACHKPLGERIRQQRGYHGRDARRRLECASCHPEHAGREAKLVSWPGGRKESFDHGETGFALQGAHGALRCAQCHVPERIRAEDVRRATDLDPAKTYLGLGTRCADCHQDPHGGQFERWVATGDCAACHAQDRWTGVNVNHAKTAFPLEGKHARVACERCHFRVSAAGARVAAATPGSFIRYRPIPHEACLDCHADPHKKRFGLDCARCHGTSGWGAIAPGAFDHDRTEYPLRGKHRGLACVTCHVSGDLKKPLKFARCLDCHSDRHEGQLARRTGGAECAACHTIEGFAPARYGVAEHAKTKFPLRGAHRAVPCSACHKAASAKALAGNVQFRVRFERCVDCHADEHAGQFASEGGLDCRKCHGEEAWRIAEFDHGRTKFALEGAHERVRCDRCHREETIAGKRTVRYRPVPTACRACHAEPPPGKGGTQS